MSGMFRSVAVLGMLWTFFTAWLMIAVQDSWKQGAGYALVVLAVMLTVYARLFALSQWAAVVVCLYGGYMAVTAPKSDIWQWTTFWSTFAIGLTVLTWRCWTTLRPGF